MISVLSSGSHQAEIKFSIGPVVSSETELLSKFIWIVGKVLFLMVVDLNFLFFRLLGAGCPPRADLSC